VGGLKFNPTNQPTFGMHACGKWRQRLDDKQLIYQPFFTLAWNQTENKTQAMGYSRWESEVLHYSSKKSI